ncbi:hydroxymethylglutaryl-CoA reductase, degradative [Streptococcus dysgalactiae subsp. equisimilis]|uniref:3-hydroxy-3-methylglutaryl coenzyme A reductase n=1 Tax=Streptococcus dysgalactiae TaxID=1334 RepID=A0A9X9QQS1_STRDY|nr:hydroxymethylglutaryl-CoA reductase, degradative [Streptococcus dysgalactiae]MCL6221570.1 hydroxymethylglutaryl-CoA reductase, degradative [Streptococcus dysgalactiae subsp. equisimilis]MEC4577068.1 hydroxymethylglutaryl-CoA reductase, degradative [Streptococcus dysgalactiae]UMY68876.1 hydroxymethylglutaryl-CoA reductase, degradative [Streptococcus dysgalactiae subsp. equisimilis]VTS30375.1 3-hydroxy-3-methylglutaryl-CoA reductase [Streptococcus dysgalactiae subsp. equisimilis]VTS34391.1 3-
MTNMNLNWAGFSKKTFEERLQLIKQFELLTPEHLQALEDDYLLPIETANQLTENVLGRFALPFSIAPDFLINGVSYQVPFVTEEPSVVAAASFAAKLIKRSGGFTSKVLKRQMIGQVALYDIDQVEEAKQAILANSDKLIAAANDAYPSIVKRGGGAREIRLEEKGDFLIFYLTVDTQEAMGANMVNTMMEALIPDLESLSKGQSLMAILSNYATESLVTASCQVDIRFLSRDKTEAQQLAKKMVLASQLAQADSYRAATHNKGIFNGIDAVVMATGNDWRAIEAGGHAYASRNGAYQGLSHWEFDQEQEVLLGQLTLPMPIASKGGSIGLNPTVSIAHDLLNQPDAKTLAQVIVSVGLAQNFAALKALTSSGIQAGHMKLHAKSLALLAGAKEEEVAPLVTSLLADKPMNLEKASQHLAILRNA